MCPPRVKLAQADMEATLFTIMRSRGFGEEYIKCYKMVSSFFHHKRPLIVLICGVPFTGSLFP